MLAQATLRAIKRSISLREEIKISRAGRDQMELIPMKQIGLLSG